MLTVCYLSAAPLSQRYLHYLAISPRYLNFSTPSRLAQLLLALAQLRLETRDLAHRRSCNCEETGNTWQLRDGSPGHIHRPHVHRDTGCISFGSRLHLASAGASASASDAAAQVPRPSA